MQKVAKGHETYTIWQVLSLSKFHEVANYFTCKENYLKVVYELHVTMGNYYEDFQESLCPRVRVTINTHRCLLECLGKPINVNVCKCV